MLTFFQLKWNHFKWTTKCLFNIIECIDAWTISSLYALGVNVFTRSDSKLKINCHPKAACCQFNWTHSHSPNYKNVWQTIFRRFCSIEAPWIAMIVFKIKCKHSNTRKIVNPASRSNNLQNLLIAHDSIRTHSTHTRINSLSLQWREINFQLRKVLAFFLPLSFHCRAIRRAKDEGNF